MIGIRSGNWILGVILSVSGGAFAQSGNPNVKDSQELLAFATMVGPVDLDRGLEQLRQHVDLISPLLCQELIKKANAAYRSGNFEKCAVLFELAREAAILSKNKAVLELSGIHRLGRIYFERSHLAKAIQANVLSKQIFEEINSRVDLILLIGDLGEFYISAGDYEAARRCSLKCLDLSASLPTSNEIAIAYGRDFGRRSAWLNLAHISVLEGDFGAAFGYLHKSLELAKGRRSTNPDWFAHDLIKLSQIYRVTGDYREALNCLTDAIGIARRLRGKCLLDEAYNTLGLLYLDQADYASAIKWLTMSLNLSSESGDRRGVAISLSNIGDAYLAQKNADTAIKSYQSALEAAESVGSPDLIAIIKQWLGAAYRADGEFARALSTLEDATRLTERLGDKNRLAEICLFKGEVYYSIGDLSNAAKLTDEAYELTEHISRPRSLLWCLALKGKVALAQGRYDLARDSIQHAIGIVEGMRDKVGGNEVGLAQFIEGSRIEPYHLMIDLLLREHKDREAFSQSELAKARVLLDVLHSGKLNVSSVISSKERERERELSGQVTALNRQIYADRQRPQPDQARLAELGASLEDARLEYESYRNGLFAAHPEVRSQRPDAWHLDWDQFARLASDNNTAFLEFVVSDEKTQAFLITGAKQSDKATNATEITTYTVKLKKKELKNLVSTFAERLGNPHIGEAAVSSRLYELLLAPAKTLLAGKTTIVIVPDSVLWDLPFQALKQTDGKYLIESYSLFYAPSLSVLGEMIKKTDRSNGPLPDVRNAASKESKPLLLALGNPSLSPQTIERATSIHRDEKLLPLPEAEREVKTLASFYRTGSSKIYVGVDAREDRAKSEMGNFQTLHFATHGILDSNSPMYSHIVLSTDDKSSDDGLLEAWEIMGMDLKAELAVLSACETARGRTGAGEGVIGMSWAFFVAGCPTTVVSQWKVDSASTSELMIEFHRNLVSKRPTQQPVWKKADALRRAMLTLMMNPRYKDPYYWAGFVVVGAG